MYRSRQLLSVAYTWLVTAVSIWFEIWEVVDPGKKTLFPGRFSKNFDFLQVISHKNRFFQANFPEKFRQFKKNRFSRQKLAIYNHFWSNYSIYLQNHYFRTYFLYMIRYNNISRPVPRPPCHPLRPPAQNLGVATPQPLGLTPLFGLAIVQVVFRKMPACVLHIRCHMLKIFWLTVISNEV